LATTAYSLIDMAIPPLPIPAVVQILIFASEDFSQLLPL